MSGKTYVTIEGKRYSKNDIQRNCSPLALKIDLPCVPGQSIRFLKKDGSLYSPMIYTCSRVKASGIWYVTLFNEAGSVWSDAVRFDMYWNKNVKTWRDLIGESDVCDVEYVERK